MKRGVYTEWQGSANLVVPYYRLPLLSKAVPCHAPAQSSCIWLPEIPPAPTMMDETKPAQLANRNRGECGARLGGCRFGLPVLHTFFCV